MSKTLWLCVITVLLALPLIYLQSNSAPLTQEVTQGDVSISFTSDRSRIIFPGECSIVTWKVEGIRAVYLNNVGEVGEGQAASCTLSGNPVLRVQFRDETNHEYTLPVEPLYLNPIVLILLISLCAFGAAAAYRLFGPNGLVTIITIVIFGPMLRILINLGADYISHNMFAATAIDNFNQLPPHFLYHALVILVYRLLPGVSFENASSIVVMMAFILNGILVYWLLNWLAGPEKNNRYRPFIYAGLAIALMLVGPISFISHAFNRTAIGPSLIDPNTYHSPTINLLKPFAVALFFYLIKCLTETTSVKARSFLILAALTVCATLAKPSYTIALVPAALVVVGYSFLRPFPSRRMLLIIGIIIPAALVLVWQYLYLYGPQSQSMVYQAKASIVFSPLRYQMGSLRVPLIWIVPELILSILFPAAVYLAYFQEARRNIPLNLAWLVFIFGAGVSYFFVEVPGTDSGNLTWNGQITLLVLFVVSVGFWLRQQVIRNVDMRFLICTAILAIHLISYLVDII